jgi:hypothetical protein
MTDIERLLAKEGIEFIRGLFQSYLDARTATEQPVEVECCNRDRGQDGELAARRAVTSSKRHADAGPVVDLGGWSSRCGRLQPTAARTRGGRSGNRAPQRSAADPDLVLCGATL